MGKKTTIGLALVAVALAGVLTFQFFGSGILPGSESYERMDAEGIAGAESLAGYGDLPDETDRLVGEAYAAVDQAHMDARAAIDERVAEVNQTVRETLDGISVSDIPPGVDAELVLLVEDPTGYRLPELPDGLMSPDLDLPIWQAPSQEGGSTSSLPGLDGLPRTGIGPIDEGLGQIEAVYESLAGSEDPLGGLGDPLAGTPLEGQLGPLGGTPDAPDAGAVDPDEDGALRAKGHASGFLGSAGDQYGQMTVEVQEWIDVQSGLLDGLEALEDEVETRLSASESLVDTELEERLTEIQSILDEETARIEGTISELEGLQERIAFEETAAVQLLVQEQVEAILATGDAQAAILVSHAEDIETDVEAQISTLHAEGQAVLDGLADYEAQTGVSMRAEAEAVMAAVAEAQDSLMAQAKVQQEYMLSEARAVQDSSVALAEDVLAQTDGVFDDLLSDIDGRLTVAVESGVYWTEAWTAWADTTTEAEVEFATETLSQYQGKAEVLLEDSTGTAFEITEDGLALAKMVMELSQQVELDAFDDIGSDLDIIGSVRDDYSTVPTPDRQERAEYWTGVIGELSGGVDSLLFVSSNVQGLSGQLFELSSEVQGALESG